MTLPEVVIRPLALADREALFALLSQLTVAPPLPEARFAALHEAQTASEHHVVLVAESAGRLVGTASLFLVRKYIRDAAICAFLEDVVVDSDARGQHVGKRLVAALVDIAKERGCYKVILSASEHNVPFYERCGFEQREQQMAMYL